MTRAGVVRLGTVGLAAGSLVLDQLQHLTAVEQHVCPAHGGAGEAGDLERPAGPLPAVAELEPEQVDVEGERPVEIGAGHRNVVESSRPCGRDRRHSEARRDEVAGENVI